MATDRNNKMNGVYNNQVGLPFSKSLVATFFFAAAQLHGISRSHVLSVYRNEGDIKDTASIISNGFIRSLPKHSDKMFSQRPALALLSSLLFIFTTITMVLIPLSPGAGTFSMVYYNARSTFCIIACPLYFISLIIYIFTHRGVVGHPVKFRKMFRVKRNQLTNNDLQCLAGSTPPSFETHTDIYTNTTRGRFITNEAIIRIHESPIKDQCTSSYPAYLHNSISLVSS